MLSGPANLFSLMCLGSRIKTLISCVLLGVFLTFAVSWRLAKSAHGKTCPPGILHRIVSLAPSNTELIYAIGAQDKLVGVSTMCDYPAAAKLKEKVGSFISINLERLCRLAPEAIFLVSGQEALASILKKQGFAVYILNNEKLASIPDNIRLLGALTGCEGKAAQLAGDFRQAMEELTGITGSTAERPRVFFCVWPSPLLTAGAGSFLDGAVTVAGGINIASDLKSSYPHFNEERLLLLHPDVVIMPPEARGQSFWHQAPWTNLAAVKNDRLYFLPCQVNDSLSRPTVRVLDGLWWLAARLHPELSGRLERWHARVAYRLLADNESRRECAGGWRR